MSLSSSCHPLVVNKPHPHSCCGASLQRQCLYFILLIRSNPRDFLSGYAVVTSGEAFKTVGVGVMHFSVS